MEKKKLVIFGGTGGLGKQLVKHNLYRRQDYPKCFRICHMVSIFKSNQLKNLNNNLYLWRPEEI